MGVRAVAIVAPYYYKLAPESVYAYFAEIARNSPIDLTLYNIPAFASPIDVTTIRRLADGFPASSHQGLLRRSGLHDAHDRGDPPQPARLHLPHRMGGRAHPHADDRLRRRYARLQQRRPGDYAQDVRHVRAGDTAGACSGSTASSNYST